MANSVKELEFMRSAKAQTAAQKVNAVLMNEDLTIVQAGIVLSMVSSAFNDAGSRVLEKTKLADVYGEAVKGEL